MQKEVFDVKRKKRGLLALAVLLMLPLEMHALAAATQAGVTLDGNKIGGKAIISNDTILLPLRSTGEALGYDITWSAKDGVRSATATQGSDRIVFDLTNQKIDDNGHAYYAYAGNSDALTLVNGRLYLESGALSSVFPVETGSATANGTVALTTFPENPVTITNVVQSETKPYFDAKIQYPQLSGMQNAEVQKSINARIKQLADTALAEGRKNAQDMEQSIKDGYGFGSAKTATDFNYEIKYNRNGLLSVIFSSYQYAGGAHGMTVRTADTFDLSSGKLISLSDLMRSGSDYTAYFDKAIRKTIDQRVAEGNLYEFPESPFKTIGTNPEYYLTDRAIVFYFQLYEYFPYAAGIQEFAVPYSEIADKINPGFRFLTQQPVTLDAKSQNHLTVGQVAQIRLDGNPTTGYTWHVENTAPQVLLPVGETYRQTTAAKDVVGAGGTYTWRFKAMKAGTAIITLRYYREWEGASSAPETVSYRVTVS